MTHVFRIIGCLNLVVYLIHLILGQFHKTDLLIVGLLFLIWADVLEKGNES